ncbi:MAG: anion permease, partial [Candidatus Obscuribacterales bacterium]|nr:anion permease [Candidatus Obscuribacterales bacterium]
MSQTRDLKSLIQWTGLVAGPSIAIIVFLFLPSSYHEANGQLVEFALSGRMTLSVMVWMAIWWLTEPIHISATALLPILLLPILGATSLKDAASPYAHPLVYLVMGGFLIALTMQKWRLDRRMALLTLNLVGSNPINMVGGIMAITAVLSAFVSNTATAAMMLPIALSIIELYHSNTAATEDLSDDLDSKNFALCALLGLAYAASIGGIATIIGTGPNSFLVGFIDETIAHQYRSEISFANWLVIGVPLTAIFLPITWFLLTRVIFPLKVKEIQGGHELIKSELAKLGSISLGEKLT